MTMIDYGDLYRALYHDSQWDGKDVCIDKVSEKKNDMVGEHPCFRDIDDGINGTPELIDERDFWTHWSTNPKTIRYVSGITYTDEWREGREPPYGSWSYGPYGSKRTKSLSSHAFCWKDYCLLYDMDDKGVHYYKVECDVFTDLQTQNVGNILRDYEQQIDECRSELTHSKRIAEEQGDRATVKRARSTMIKMYYMEDVVTGALDALETGEFNEWYKNKERENMADQMQAESIHSQGRAYAVRDALKAVRLAANLKKPESIDIEKECIL